MVNWGVNLGCSAHNNKRMNKIRFKEDETVITRRLQKVSFPLAITLSHLQASWKEPYYRLHEREDLTSNSISININIIMTHTTTLIIPHYKKQFVIYLLKLLYSFINFYKKPEFNTSIYKGQFWVKKI
jgi:hypothetical protein